MTRDIVLQYIWSKVAQLRYHLTERKLHLRKEHQGSGTAQSYSSNCFTMGTARGGGRARIGECGNLIYCIVTDLTVQ